MKNKKSFLLFSFLTFISCFFCIDKISAYTYNGVELNKDFFDKGWSLLEGTQAGPNYEIYSQKDFPYVYCSYSTANSQSFINCIFLNDFSFYSINSSSTIRLFSSANGIYASAPGFSYNISTKSYSTRSANSFYIYKNTVTNFDIYNNSNELLKTKSFDYNPGPITFEYNNIINTNNIDYVEFKFDNFPLSEVGFSYKFRFISVLSDGSLSENQIPQPFGREYYTGCDEESQSCSSSLKKKDYLFFDIDRVSKKYEYLDLKVFNDNPEHITSSYSIILPLDKDIGKYINLYLVSDYEYETIIHYKNDVGSNYSYLNTIDITNKYGIVFAPWYDNDVYVDDDTFYLTDFRVVGNVDIHVTDSRYNDNYNILQLYSMNYCNNTYLEQSDIPYNCDNTSGVFKFKIDNKTANQTLRFVNHSYSNSIDIDTFVTYDSRYFNYTILETPYSIGELVDPVTGDKNNVSLNDFYNQLNNQSNKGFKSSLNRFLEPIKFIFRYVTKLFNEFLNASLKDYFTFAFSIMIIILVIRVIF